MSTRANVFVDYNGERVQLYHHYDGYPEGVGKMLASFLEIATYTAKERTTKGVKNRFMELLKLDDHFEVEKVGLHGDIEYLYFVKFNENEKDIISFIKIDFTALWKDEDKYLYNLEKLEKGEKELSIELKIK
jgi:hypothetical protein